MLPPPFAFDKRPFPPLLTFGLCGLPEQWSHWPYVDKQWPLLTCRVPEGPPPGRFPSQDQGRQMTTERAGLWPFAGPGVPPPELTIERPDPLAGHATAPQPFQALFLIYRPDFSPELVEINLGAPCSVNSALAAASVARHPQDRHDFPVLVPVYPQTHAGFGLVLAQPDWEFNGVHVLFDCSELDARMFSLAIASVVDRASLLSIAGVAANAPVLVYIGGSPWPLEPRTPVRPQEGDCISILPVEHDVMILASLEDMLLSAQGWRQEYDFPGEHNRGLWILTDAEPFRLAMPTDNRRRIRRAIAEELGCPPDLLRITPTRVQVVDHADRGHLTNAVIVALCQFVAGNIPVEDETFLDEVGPTLLGRLPEHERLRGFWESATLIETLLEHFAAKIRSPGPVRTEWPRQCRVSPHSSSELVPLADLRETDECSTRGAPDPQRPPLTSSLQLAACLGPVQYDLTVNAVDLPHQPALVSTLTALWPANWFLPNTEHLPVSQAVRAYRSESMCLMGAPPAGPWSRIAAHT